MIKKIKIAITIVGLATSISSNAELIRTYESIDKSSRCNVDPNDATKMYCEQYCQFFDVAGHPIGQESKGFNCDDRDRRNQKQAEWNFNNPDRQIQNCTKGEPDWNEYHQSPCEVIEDRLLIPTFISAHSAISWSGINPVCDSLLSDSEYEANGCPVLHTFVRFNLSTYSTLSMGVLREMGSWATSSDPGASSQSIADKYEMTISGNTSDLNIEQRNNFLLIEYRDNRPDRNRPGLGDTESEIHTVDLRTCEIGNQSNCVNTQIDLVLSQDHG